MGLVIKIIEIMGKCPVYKVGDRIVIEDGCRVNLEKTTAICMHSLSAIMPYYVAINKGISPVELGLSKQGNKAYVQCLDPCKYTGGGTVIFEIERINTIKSENKMKHFAELGENCIVQENVILGLKYKEDCQKVKIGNNAIIRSGTIIYADVIAGDYFQTGHNVVIREKTTFGSFIVVGTNTVIDGHVTIGDFVKIESNCYIPTHVKIGSYVFLGPGVVLTNDKYPQKMRDQYKPSGPTIEDGVTLGAGVVVLPGVRIGKGSFVAAGSVVTKDVSPMSLVKGVPGKVYPLPEKLKELNIAKNWRKYVNNEEIKNWYNRLR